MAAGFRPGWSYILPTVSKMIDPRYQPTLRENLALGVGKAQRQVVYSHHEYRNYERSHLGTTGKVPR